jgi:hypothetical protein
MLPLVRNGQLRRKKLIVDTPAFGELTRARVSTTVPKRYAVTSKPLTRRTLRVSVVQSPCTIG